MTSASRNGQSILELALSRKNLISDMVSVERTLLVVGSKNSGKTTLIHTFFDKNEKPKPTLALEYSFARRSGKSLAKDVCHVWELGIGLGFNDLLSVIIDKTTGRRLSVIIVLDLSRPDILWNTLDMLLEEVKTRLENAIVEIKKNDEPSVQNTKDGKNMHSFPVPLMIVGTKYDVYRNFEPAKKRIMCQCLRYVAHTYGASLMFYNMDDTVLVKRSKEMMSHYGFGTSFPKNCVQDSNKPLLVPAGSDCFDKIDNTNDIQSIRSINKYKQLFVSNFKQTALDCDQHATNTENADPLVDPNYADPLIDESLKKKQEELKLFVDSCKRFSNAENAESTSSRRV